MLEHLRDEGFKVQYVKVQLGLDTLPASRQRLPLRHQLLAVEALDQGLVSESRFAQLLEVDRLDARAIFATLKSEELSF